MELLSFSVLLDFSKFIWVLDPFGQEVDPLFRIYDLTERLVVLAVLRIAALRPAVFGAHAIVLPCLDMVKVAKLDTCSLLDLFDDRRWKEFPWVRDFNFSSL